MRIGTASAPWVGVILVLVAGGARAEQLPSSWTAAQQEQYRELAEVAAMVRDKENLTRSDLRKVMVAVADKDKGPIDHAFREFRRVSTSADRDEFTYHYGDNLVLRRLKAQAKDGVEFGPWDVWPLGNGLLAGYEVNRRAEQITRALERTTGLVTHCSHGMLQLWVEQGIVFWEVTDEAGKGEEVRARIDENFRNDPRDAQREKTLDGLLVRAKGLIAEHESVPCEDLESGGPPL